MVSIKQYFYLPLFLLTFTFIGCLEIKTSDKTKTFKYWTGTKPAADIELLSGQYWQSSHWTKEYIMYLKFKCSKDWWDKFLKQNYIPVDRDEWTKPSEAPNWFSPSKNSIRFGIKDDLDQGSRYFRDSITGISFIYEIQL